MSEAQDLPLVAKAKVNLTSACKKIFKKSQAHRKLISTRLGHILLKCSQGH